MKKDIEWLREEVNELPLRFLGFSVLKQREEFTVSKDDVLELINQLDEPEVLSQEWIEEHKETIFDLDEDFETEFIKIEDLQNLLVPKQEEQIAKTVADVIADFYKSLELLKEVLRTEVEEKEEC